LFILYIDIGPTLIITYFLVLEISSKMIVWGEREAGEGIGGEKIIGVEWMRPLVNQWGPYP
jgi:hypothetical protein